MTVVRSQVAAGSDPNSRTRVVVYTDGACLGNPGPGWYGAVLQHRDQRRELCGGFRLTTSNRMELMAAIAALEALRLPCAVTIHSDSQYLCDSMMNGWARQWRANGWKRNRKEKAVNTDLWARLLDLCEHHDVDFVWVRGHAGDRENERCHRLSTVEARRLDLPSDEPYELQNRSPTGTLWATA